MGPDVANLSGRIMNFNLGITQLSNFQKMISVLAESGFDDATSEALNSRWARQVEQRA